MPDSHPLPDADWRIWTPFSAPDDTDTPIMNDDERNALQDAVDESGEVHAILEEHDAELEIRRGQVGWDDPCDGMFCIYVSGESYPFPYDRIVRWYVPTSIWHD